MPLTNAKIVLEEALNQLQEIEQLYAQSLNDKNVPKQLFVKIKNFLENAKSPLDYCANYIFDTYCVHHIEPSKLNNKKRNCYFPIKPTPENFNGNIDNQVFIGLRTKRPDIVSLFEQYQPYQIGVTWTKNLNALVNPNKHIDLTPQEKKINQTQSFIQIKNSTFGNNGADIAFGNVRLNLPQNKPISTDLFLTKTWVSILFTDLNLPVLPTLKEILSGVQSAINEFEKVI